MSIRLGPPAEGVRRPEGPGCRVELSSEVTRQHAHRIPRPDRFTPDPVPAYYGVPHPTWAPLDAHRLAEKDASTPRCRWGREGKGQCRELPWVTAVAQELHPRVPFCTGESVPCTPAAVSVNSPPFSQSCCSLSRLPAHRPPNNPLGRPRRRRDRRSPCPPADGTATVNPLDPVSVNTTGGTLETVTMTNDEGRVIEGIFTPDRLSWKPGVPLGYGRTYTLAVTAIGDQGIRSEKTSTFSTVTPGNQTKPTFVTTGGNLLADGGTFGVGIVIVTHFDEPITDRAAAEKALHVEATPPVNGSWYWADDQNVHWRPENYWTPGTQVTVRAAVYGIPLGEGLFGQEDAQTSFTIGDAHISVADDTTKQVTVTDNGQVVRTMRRRWVVAAPRSWAGRPSRSGPNRASTPSSIRPTRSSWIPPPMGCR